MEESIFLSDEAATRALGARLIREAKIDDVFLLIGELGAGKTTLVRGALFEAGWTGAVRSPTYNLIAEYETNPPILHADLFRVDQPIDSLDLIEAIKGRVSFIEWPDSLPELKSMATAIVTIEFDGEHRSASVSKKSTLPT